jgi:copper chaperone CopZ
MCDTNEYAVQGMTCSSCATKVGAAVRQVPGVSATDVDLASGTVTVTGPGVERDAVRAAIAAAGYQVE